MRFPLAVKILAFLLVTLMLVVSGAWWVARSQEERIVRTELDANARILARAIDHGLSASMLSDNKAEAREMVDDLVGDGPIMRIAIYGVDGRPWYDTDGRSDPLLLGAPETVRRAAETGLHESAFGTRKGVEIYEVLSPIAAKRGCLRCHAERENLGVVGVVLSTGDSRAHLSADRRLLVQSNLASVALLVIVLGGTLAVMVVRPLKKLGEAAEAVASGDLGLRVDEGRKDEIGDLGSAFNSMTERLEQQIRDLESTRAELQETIERVGQAISSAHRLEDLMEVLAREAAKIGRADASAIFFFSEQDELVICGARGLSAADVAEYNRRPLKRTDAVVREVIERRLECADLDPAGDPDRARMAVLPTASSHYAVPIAVEGKSLGLISIADRDGCQLTEDARRMLSALASQAGLAVEQIRLNEQTKVMAITDGLTGLYNHRYFQERLAVELERATRFAHPLALVMVDVDKFKQFNDRHGHLAGDAVLEGLGAVLKETTRRIDLAARYGGEEFAVILIETSLEEAVSYAERLRARVDERLLAPEVPQGAEHITISAGVAVFPQNGAMPEPLILAADKALYQAKAAGRNRVVAAPPGMPLG